MSDGVTAFLLLGSNLGDRFEQLDRARQRIRARIGGIIKESSIYETEPWGLESQPLFLNQVVSVNTDLSPLELLDVILGIEKEMGRVRAKRFGARPIDIDILFFGHQVIDLPRLAIPHPGIPSRRFTLAPLAEIAPGMIHPVLDRSMAELLAACTDTLRVGQIKDSPPMPGAQSS